MSAPFCAGVDWGTTAFRLWLLDAAGTVLGKRRSDEGLMGARAHGFEAVLESHLAKLGAPADLPVVMCGMVGARSGWVEADYLDAPVHLRQIAARAVRVRGPRRPVHILPGIAQRDPAAPDVMRGEETKLLGLGETVRGLVVMPGTHPKWARLEDGRLLAFSTAMTGEIFAHLREAQGSVLREILAGTAPVEAASPHFRAGLAQGLAAPAGLLSALFGLRASALLLGAGGDDLLARASGLLIGAEMAGMTARFGALSSVTLVGSGPGAALYAAALEAAGFAQVARVDGEAAVRRGLVEAARSILADDVRGVA